MRPPLPGPQRPSSRIGTIIAYAIAWALILALIWLTIDNVEAQIIDTDKMLERHRYEAEQTQRDLDRMYRGGEADRAARDRRYMLEEMREIRREQERTRRSLRDCESDKALYGSSYRCY